MKRKKLIAFAVTVTIFATSVLVLNKMSDKNSEEIIYSTKNYRITNLSDSKPYAIFGEDTPMLMTKHEEEGTHQLTVDGFGADGMALKLVLDTKTGLIEVSDANGNIVSSKTLSEQEMARWFGVDPLAEKYSSLSPYNYCANNPTNAVDVDGRLIVFVAGFNVGKYVDYMTFTPISLLLSKNHSYMNPNRHFAGSDNYGWGGVDKLYMKEFKDNNALYVRGDSYPFSKANDRYEAGRLSGMKLIEEFNSGSRTLADGENIRLVGYSMGAAYAAGMAEALMNSNYADKLQLVDYIAPHQPEGFNHPNGVLGRQFGSENDILSSRGKEIRNMKQFNKYIGDFGTGKFPGGHTFNDGLYDFLLNCFNNGVNITIK